MKTDEHTPAVNSTELLPGPGANWWQKYLSLRPQMAYVLCLMLPCAILFWEIAEVALSLLMFGVLFLGLVRPQLQAGFKDIWQDKAWLASIGFVLLLLPSFFYSDNWGGMMSVLRIKLPLMALPLGFALLPRLSARQYYGIFYLLLMAMTATGLGVAIYYFVNYEAINQLITVSKPIPTPIHHIRFSLMAVLAVVGGIELWRQGFYLKYVWERKVILLATLFLFVFVHLLSVRSGLMALYLAVFCLAVYHGVRAKRYWLTGAVLLALASMPVAAYYTIPSFRAKLSLTMWNMHVYRSGEIGHYSDTQRMTSYIVGLELGARSPMWGTGLGDLKDEVKRLYSERYPDISPMLPHNQFLFFYAGAGLPVTLFFAALFFFILFYKKRYLEPIFLGFHAIVFSSFLTENTLETAVGAAFYACFLSFGISHLHKHGITNIQHF